MSEADVKPQVDDAQIPEAVVPEEVPAPEANMTVEDAERECKKQGEWEPW
jgi:hypothetical protein